MLTHRVYTASVLISIDQNPQDFQDFNTSDTGVELPLAVEWFSGTGSGEICIPVDIASLNIEGVDDGSNVTLQAMFTGGHGNLFQVISAARRLCESSRVLIYLYSPVRGFDAPCKRYGSFERHLQPYSELHHRHRSFLDISVGGPRSRRGQRCTSAYNCSFGTSECSRWFLAARLIWIRKRRTCAVLKYFLRIQ